MYQLEKMPTIQEQISELDSTETLVIIKDRLVEGINSMINGFSSENPIVVVILISILIGVGIKRWKKLEWSEAIIAMLLIFMSLRFLGIPN